MPRMLPCPRWHRKGHTPFLVQGLNVFYPQTKDEEVLSSGFLSYLLVGTIHVTDGEGTIEHELHVACAGGLSARGGDLL